MEVETVIILFAFALIGVLLFSKDTQAIRAASIYLGAIVGAAIVIYARDK